MLFAQGRQFFLAFFNLPLYHVDDFLDLAEYRDIYLGECPCDGRFDCVTAMLVDRPSVYHFHQLVRTGSTSDDCHQHLLIAPGLYCVDVVAQTESASLHRSIKFVAIVCHILVEIHDATVELAHVLNNRFWHEAPFDKIL